VFNSFGERQRIASGRFARFRILILDERTASIDSDRGGILDALDRLSAGERRS
jgi:alpha-D-ribose 1-methylphosphonate 5-triphosphate synthase subunit PhnL